MDKIKYLLLLLLIYSSSYSQQITRSGTRVDTTSKPGVASKAYVDSSMSHATGGSADSSILATQYRVDTIKANRVPFWRYYADTVAGRYYSDGLYQAKGSYMGYSDTVSLSNRINLKLNISDTANKWQRIGTYLIPSDSGDIRTYSDLKYQPKIANGTDGYVWKMVGTSQQWAADLTGGGGSADSGVFATKAWVLDSLDNKQQSGTYYTPSDTTNTLATKKYADSKASVLDTTSLSNRINLKLNIADTTNKWQPKGTYLVPSDTSNTHNLPDDLTWQNLKLTRSDTIALSNRIDKKLNSSDTTNFYNLPDDLSWQALKLTRSDTSTLSSRIDTKLSKSDTIYMSDRIDGRIIRHGFENRTATSIAFNSGNRYLKITGSSFNIYNQGTKVVKNTDSIIINNTVGMWYIYYNSSNVLTAGQVNWTIGIDIPIASVFWNGTTGLISDERHGGFPPANHLWSHLGIGAIYLSGLSTAFADSTFQTETGGIADEDLTISVSSPVTSLRTFYRSSMEYTFTASLPRYHYRLGANLYYDNAGTLTPATSNYYVAYFIYATNFVNEPIISVMGQRQDQTIAVARTNNLPNNLSLGTLPSREMKLLYRVIVRNDATPYEEVVDYRTTAINGSTVTLTDHQTLTNRTATDAHPWASITGAGDSLQLIRSSVIADDTTWKVSKLNRTDTVALSNRINAKTDTGTVVMGWELGAYALVSHNQAQSTITNLSDSLTTRVMRKDTNTIFITPATFKDSIDNFSRTAHGHTGYWATADTVSTLAKKNTATAGSYTNVSATIGLDGRITAMSSGAGGSGGGGDSLWVWYAPTRISDTLISVTSNTVFKAGLPIRFKKSDSTDYSYAIISSVMGVNTANADTLVISGANFSASANMLWLGKPEKTVKYDVGIYDLWNYYNISGGYFDSLIYLNTGSEFKWGKSDARLVQWGSKSRTADGTSCSINIWKNAETLIGNYARTSNAGWLYSSTHYISLTNYKVVYGDYLDLRVYRGTGDAKNLTFSMWFVLE